MSHLSSSLAQLFGAKPRRPPRHQQSPAIRKLYARKRGKLSKADVVQMRHAHRRTCCNKWQRRRWLTLMLVNLLFVMTYAFDLQWVKGSLTASEVVGVFPMTDLHSALQVTLAHQELAAGLVIGSVTVFLLWLLLGGRSFCSWVCPYHLLSEWAEYLHLWLVKRRLVCDHPFNRKVRGVFYLSFAALALITGYTVFETFSPTGIISRALIYGPGLALIWVGSLLLFEIFYSRRAWCRYLCPIGLTYGIVGLASPVGVKYDASACHHEGDCRKVCLVPHVLHMTIRGGARDVVQDIGADCTRCGMCVDVCPTGSLSYQIKGLSKTD